MDAPMLWTLEVEVEVPRHVTDFLIGEVFIVRGIR